MAWWLWLAFGLVLLLIELVTPSGFFVMFFGLGAVTVGVLAGLQLAGPAAMQWLIFTALSLGYVALLRGPLHARLRRTSPEIDTLVGEIASPRERIPPGAIGRVELRGTSWSARNETAVALEPGMRCRVTRVDGLVVSVAPE